jgi:hypothetical protein
VLIRRPCRSKPREFTPRDLRRIALRVCARYGAQEVQKAVDDALRICGLRCVPVQAIEQALALVRSVGASIRRNPNPVTDTVMVLVSWWEAVKNLLAPAIERLPARARLLLGAAELSGEALQGLASGELEEELALALGAARECEASRDGFRTGGGF